MHVRRATNDDLPTLLEFEQGVIAAERPFDPTLKPDPVRYYDLDWLLGSDRAAVMVVVDGELVVGSGYARIDDADAFLRHRHFAYLGFMYVRPSHRGRGASRLVIDHLVAWAAERGVTEVRLEVYPGNRAAISAYERAGFVAHMVTMRRA